MTDTLANIKTATPEIMGILNVTSDSFYDGGCYLQPEVAIKQANRLIAEGASIIDIGAESSRPGAAPVGVQEEIDHLLPVLEQLPSRDSFRLSVDTSRAAVFQKALAFRVDILNDIYALRRDTQLAGLAASARCQVVLMHMQGSPMNMQDQPTYEDIMDDLKSFFTERMDYAVREGIAIDKIILDPGIGFGKTLEHNLTILKNLSQLRALGRPLLVGPSRKSFIGQLTGSLPEDRLPGSAAVIAHLVREQVEFLRVHDVRAMKDVITVTKALGETRREAVAL